MLLLQKLHTPSNSIMAPKFSSPSCRKLYFPTPFYILNFNYIVPRKGANVIQKAPKFRTNKCTFIQFQMPMLASNKTRRIKTSFILVIVSIQLYAKHHVTVK